MPILAARFSSPRRAGFTLTELAIVLGVVGLILAGIWSGAQAVYQSQRAEQTVRYLTQIASGVKSTFAAYPAKQLLPADVTLLANNGVIPSEMVTAAGNSTTAPTMVNLWGGAVTILHLGNCLASTGLANCWKVSLASLPQKACVELLSRMGASNATTQGLDSITNAAGKKNTAFPLTPLTAKDFCTATTDTNDLIFVYQPK